MKRFHYEREGREYRVYDRQRGFDTVMASSSDLRAVEAIVDALNAAHETGALA